MRQMSEFERSTIERQIEFIVGAAASDEYAMDILRSRGGSENMTFLEDVIIDVMEASAWDDEGYYNADDIRLAIGRVLCDRLGID